MFYKCYLYLFRYTDVQSQMEHMKSLPVFAGFALLDL
jgi:hypothetical protein